MSLFSPNYLIISDGDYFRELYRPWKLLTFLVGMAWLIYGALNFKISDWDVGVSILMGGLTYLLAPWTVFLIGSAICFRPRRWPVHVLLGFFVALTIVDTCYVLYHTIVGNEMYRDANFLASITLYFIAGFLLRSNYGHPVFETGLRFRFK
jgi:F0F1-type ATP synthase assembly protein I